MPAFTVGGTLTGLPAGDTVTLQDNGSDNLTLSTNGTFTFPTALPDGHAYSITVSGTSGGYADDLHAYERQRNHLRRQCDERCVQCTSTPPAPRSRVTRTWTCYNAAVADGTDQRRRPWGHALRRTVDRSG